MKGSRVPRMPIASSIPWMGNGVCTSQRLKPRSRTFSTALTSRLGLSNSIIMP
jgi:hypothetical protein